MDWKNYIINNGIQDILIPCIVKKESDNLKFLPINEFFFVKSSDKILRFTLDENWNFTIDYFEQIAPNWSDNSNKNNKFGYSSIYEQFFKVNYEINIVDIFFNEKSRNKIIFKYNFYTSSVYDSIITIDEGGGIIFG
ncbi:hypothetical protein [Bartonella sp. HY761]|uniref:hypothetical protein n=1 Tax=Bartonella sp. HY761 TaxID=2979330 RepID=UPI0021FD9B3C|nr:hypothetical protein [Bartonella sp. HY761]UXN05893.1 hypothetical protein N6A79_11430 [Bartonella sp. HY761]